MGADSARRFYGGGRPRTSQAPLPCDTTLSHQHKSQHKNVQRARRRRELREEDEAEGALIRALDGLAHHQTAAGAAKTLTRMQSDPTIRADMVRRGAVASLVLALPSKDSEIALLCCHALGRLLSGAAEQQDQAVTAGAFRVLLDQLQMSAETPSVVTSTCQVLERMATGVGAASRREAAKGVLPLLIQMCRRWTEAAEPLCHASCRAALRSLTRDAPHLHEVALAAGADSGWLL